MSGLVKKTCKYIAENNFFFNEKSTVRKKSFFFVRFLFEKHFFWREKTFI